MINSHPNTHLLFSPCLKACLKSLIWILSALKGKWPTDTRAVGGQVIYDSHSKSYQYFKPINLYPYSHEMLLYLYPLWWALLCQMFLSLWSSVISNILGEIGQWCGSHGNLLPFIALERAILHITSVKHEKHIIKLNGHISPITLDKQKLCVMTLFTSGQ